MKAMPMALCPTHGGQGGMLVSPGVCQAMQDELAINMVYLVLYLEGSEKSEGVEETKEEEEAVKQLLYASFSCHAKKEEVGVFPLTGRLSRYEDGWGDGYVMTFDDEPSWDEAVRTIQPVCRKCFAEFVSTTKSALNTLLPA
ncbi:MAG: hypothetical protein LBQ75_10555 [Zoogloeaceae bacterium]|jgi:hypothetical protein|nr:hypothetical protein [Zoogloeaceae bacterium]